MAVPEEQSLEDSTRDLLESPGGQILVSIRHHLKNRMYVLFGLFLLGFMLAFPFAGTVISWLVEGSGFVPKGTDVVILSPIELLALKLRIAAFAGLSIGFLLLVIDASLNGFRHPAVKARIAEADLKIPKPGLAVLLTLTGILFLVILSQWWTLSFIIPLVLEYLASDAAAAGLDTTWRLSAFIGFIINLCFAGLIAFQTPLVTLVAIRSGAVESRVIRNHRKHVWFASIVMGALLSPPDPLSMILVAAPMLLLFEVALLIDKIFSVSKT